MNKQLYELKMAGRIKWQIEKMTQNVGAPKNTVDNIGYPPAGTTAKEMISLYLKKAAQAQIPHTSPAGG